MLVREFNPMSYWKNIPTQKLSAMFLVGGFSILGLSDNLILLIEKEAGLWQFHFFRSLLAVPLLLLVTLYLRQPIIPKRLGPVLLRTSLVTIALLLYFGALPMMPIAIVASCLFTSPIFVLIFSALFFKKKIGYKRIIAVVLGACGVLLILEPNTSEFSLYTLIPILAGAIYALNNITIRELCASEPPLCLVTFFYLALGIAGLIGATLGSTISPPDDIKALSPFVFSGRSAPSGLFLIFVAMHAVASMIAVWMVTRAYQISETSKITVFDYSFVIFAGLGGWVFWDQELNTANLIGIAIIILAGSIITFTNQSAR